MSANEKRDERSTWSDADFGQMSWHDVHIHGMSAMSDLFELHFDVDYIVEWMCAPSRSGRMTFRLAPATLVFKNVHHVHVAFESEQGILSIDEVSREGPRQPPHSSLPIWNWILKCQEGSVRFDATGYHLALRAPPIVSDLQYLSTEQRRRLLGDPR